MARHSSGDAVIRPLRSEVSTNWQTSLQFTVKSLLEICTCAIDAAFLASSYMSLCHPTKASIHSIYQTDIESHVYSSQAPSAKSTLVQFPLPLLSRRPPSRLRIRLHQPEGNAASSKRVDKIFSRLLEQGPLSCVRNAGTFGVIELERCLQPAMWTCPGRQKSSFSRAVMI